MVKRLMFVWIALLAVLVVGCAPATTTSTTSTDLLMLPLVNVRTGETFTLASFAGKTVFVETMATWCSNCRAQLTNVGGAVAQLPADQYVFIALEVEANVTNDALRQYADNNGFGWTFAVATPEVLAAIVAQYGRTAITPPSTPHFIIRPDGTLPAQITTGIESTEQLIAQLRGV
jgi:thiol-disulfide isomerase/thioredoxin